MPQRPLNQKPLFPCAPHPIVIIGAGGIVRDAHLPAYRKAGFEVAGIYDLNVDRAQSLARQFAVRRVFRSLEEAVTGVSANVVFDVAVPAAALVDVLPHLPEHRGVLIQKPLGENLDQARRIVKLCYDEGLLAAVNFQLRYAPYVLAARDLVDQGAIGELHDMEVRVSVYTPWALWSFMQGIPRVEILYHSIHYLDLLRSFLGDPREVYAKTLKHPLTPQLAATRSTLILDYGDTVRACVSASHGHVFGQRHQESFIKWEGTRGSIIAKMGLLMNYPQGVPDEMEFCILQESEPPRWERVDLEGSWFPDAFIGTMSSVMRWVEGTDQRAATSVDDALKTMALVEAAYKSSEQGGEPVPYS
ncbi:MAG: Gfo/Idh/MocA family oxidoreductase [Acidobacteriota bacterium]|nr:Gfo/Idh/MocA family oxidoreductase [Acidobacteriota bacterium]